MISSCQLPTSNWMLCNQLSLSPSSGILSQKSSHLSLAYRTFRHSRTTLAASLLTRLNVLFRMWDLVFRSTARPHCRRNQAQKTLLLINQKAASAGVSPCQHRTAALRLPNQRLRVYASLAQIAHKPGPTLSLRVLIRYCPQRSLQYRAYCNSSAAHAHPTLTSQCCIRASRRRF